MIDLIQERRETLETQRGSAVKIWNNVSTG